MSRAPYHSLNLALHVGDEEAAVTKNRKLLRRGLNLPAEPCWLNQTHSTRVSSLNATQAFETNADAAITRDLDVVATVMTADCLPILLCNLRGDEVAAVHAGWRGLADGVVQATLAQMQSSADQIMAWIGPAISQQQFEVGDEVRDLFLQNHSNAAGRFLANRPNHWLCDLPGLAADLLLQTGISDVTLSGLCTYQLDQQFYSYRRDNVCGRMANLIWINSIA